MPGRRAARASSVAALLLIVAATGASASPPSPSPGVAAATCDCAHFADELTAARALYSSRGEGATIRLSGAARERFRERLAETYARTACLVACTSVPDEARNAARALFAAAAFKSRTHGPVEADARQRLTRALDESERCLAVEPAHPGCHLWRGSIRGVLARGSWSPANLALPKQLAADFAAARAGLPPGQDPPDGAATRAEASLLLHAPRIAGGDVAKARQLLEAATNSSLYACTVANRLLFAEALTRSGAPQRAIAELRATLVYGLPACGDNRYENASDLEETARCLAALESHPDVEPRWDDDCR